MSSDKFEYFSADVKDPCGKYTQPKTYTTDMGGKENVGYPNAVPNTQTQITRGGKAQTKGRGHTTKMG
jgi:hypothetical protein